MSESPYNPVGPAIGNAIANATGIRFHVDPVQAGPAVSGATREIRKISALLPVGQSRIAAASGEAFACHAGDRTAAGLLKAQAMMAGGAGLVVLTPLARIRA